MSTPLRHVVFAAAVAGLVAALATPSAQSPNAFGVPSADQPQPGPRRPRELAGVEARRRLDGPSDQEPVDDDGQENRDRDRDRRRDLVAMCLPEGLVRRSYVHAVGQY